MPPTSDAAARLAAAGIEAPRREARRLLAEAASQGVPPESLLTRRLAHEPFAFIAGHQPFWTLDLLVSPDTLIPRADSEALIELAAELAPHAGRVLDLGTGTGCLLLAALAERPAAWGLGVDRVPAAAALARRNAARNGLARRTAFLCADWAAPLAASGAAGFDLVLCNPPYIEHAAIAGLMPDVARWEPASALDGGADGLDAYRAVLAALPGLLAPGGVAILELGQGQEAAVGTLAQAHGLVAGPARPDLAGIARALPVSPEPRRRLSAPSPPG